MNESRNSLNGKEPPRTPAQFLLEWLLVLLRTIGGMITEVKGDLARGEEPLKSDGGQSLASRQVGQFPIQKPVSGYIASGIRKVQRARYSSAMRSEYGKVTATIQLTRRAIRKAPRSSRYLFEGYGKLLEDAGRKVELIMQHARIADEHLWRYDPQGLADEVVQLESYLKGSCPPEIRAETEGTLAARRQLLESVRTTDHALSSAAAQLRFIAATLELNHVRVITISSRVSRPAESESQMLNDRMQELTEQLALLEESIRELDGV